MIGPDACAGTLTAGNHEHANVILMDDDILCEPESALRLNAFANLTHTPTIVVPAKGVLALHGFARRSTISQTLCRERDDTVSFKLRKSSSHRQLGAAAPRARPTTHRQQPPQELPQRLTLGGDDDPVAPPWVLA